MTEKQAKKLVDGIEKIIDEKIRVAILFEQESGWGTDTQKSSDEIVGVFKRQLVRDLRSDGTTNA